MTVKRFLTTLIVLAILMPVFAGFVASEYYVNSERLPLASQLGIPQGSAAVPEGAAVIAISKKDYPVTPGDVYIFSFYTSGGNVATSQSIQVDAQCRVNIPYIGVIDAKGMTYLELKEKVLDDLNSFYSYLRPQFSLSSCGAFEIWVHGEVNYATPVKTWSLARLSDLIDYATKYASTRNVYITYADGTEKCCDLYSAFADDRPEENPYLEPGCEVRFVKADKSVFINGRVRKGGQFQLNPDDTLSTLIEGYARGFEFDADKTYITVGNYKDGEYVTETLSFDENKDRKLNDMDAIYVGRLNSARPFITIQGAIEGGKFNYEFVTGETAEHVIRSLKGRLLGSTDESGVYVLRGGRKIAVDTESAITSTEQGTTVLQQGDILVFPYTQQYVTVAGAVANPSNYPYEPDKSAEYYINLAGGLTPDAKKKTLKITNSEGKNVSLKQPVIANSMISVEHRNTNMANIITLVISIATFGFTAYSAINGIITN